MSHDQWVALGIVLGLVAATGLISWALFHLTDGDLREREVARFERHRSRMSDAEFVRRCAADIHQAPHVLSVRAVLGGMTGVSPEFIHPEERLLVLWQLLGAKEMDQPWPALRRRLAEGGLAMIERVMPQVKTVRDLAALALATRGFEVLPATRNDHSASAQMRGSGQAGSNST